jgi:hypothetical protein
MKEINELYEFARRCAGGMGGDALQDIANRIDAAVTSKLLDANFAGYRRAIDELNDKSMPLPVDADYEVYHLGDRVKGIPWEDGVVTGIQFEQVENGKVNASIAVRPHGWDTSTWHDPEDFRHYHEPTVEDVLREFADDVYADSPNVLRDRDAIVERYAAKLRLAEEVDE